MATGTDFIGAFRAYAQKALGNDFNPEKAAATLNTWVKESGDALKERIERDTERAVKKLGLAKESELRALEKEVAALRAAIGLPASGKKRSAGSSNDGARRKRAKGKVTSASGVKKKSAGKGAKAKKAVTTSKTSKASKKSATGRSASKGV
jgi:hypothetical protein